MKKYFDKTNLIFSIICLVCFVTMIALLIFPIINNGVHIYQNGEIFFGSSVPRDVLTTPFSGRNFILVEQTAVFCSIALVFLVFAVLLTIRLARKGMFADMKAKIQANRKPTKAEQIADLQRQIDELKQLNNDQNKKD